MISKAEIQTQNASDVVTHSDAGASPRWSIQDFARQFDVTPRTIRFYEDKGLLSPRREAGSRVFGPGDQARLDQIMRGKRLGFSLEDIKIVLDVKDGIVDAPDDLTRHQKNFSHVIQSLRRQRKDIDIVAQEMSALCGAIEARLEEARLEEAKARENIDRDMENIDRDMDTGPDNVKQLARAYQTAFERHLAPDTASNMNENRK